VLPRLQIMNSTHLFASVVFSSALEPQSWREMFPDPSIFPTRYAKSLYMGTSDAVRGWIQKGEFCLEGSITSWTWDDRSKNMWRLLGGRSRPTPRILTRHQIPPRGFYHLSILTDLRLRLLVSPFSKT